MNVEQIRAYMYIHVYVCTCNGIHTIKKGGRGEIHVIMFTEP